MTFSPLVLFLIAGLASPGPNTIMLTASGARFGAKATWPHLSGVVLGVGIIGAFSALGVGAVLQASPALKFALQILAALWIFWMAYELLRSKGTGRLSESERPMTFVEAVIFQWINPKLWAVALAASSGYGLGLPPAEEALRMGVTFSCVNLFVCTFWTYSGQLLSKLLNSVESWRIFRLVMAFLLALSALLVFK
ncbi:MAG: LysE family translocator [Rhodobacteraceae bacterium]|nr:LysE family translocator [Paracoccaceae bacterium]